MPSKTAPKTQIHVVVMTSKNCGLEWELWAQETQLFWTYNWPQSEGNVEKENRKLGNQITNGTIYQQKTLKHQNGKNCEACALDISIPTT